MTITNKALKTSHGTRTKMGKSKFTISLLGFDQRSTETLSEATQRTMKIIEPITPGETQVVVIDLDDPASDNLWSSFREQWPYMPVVVLSSQDNEIEDVNFVEKPFTVETLIDNITEAIIMAPSPNDKAEQPEPAVSLDTEIPLEIETETDAPGIEEPEPAPVDESSSSEAELELAEIESADDTASTEPSETDLPDIEPIIETLEEAPPEAELELAPVEEATVDTPGTIEPETLARDEEAEKIAELMQSDAAEVSGQDLEALTTGGKFSPDNIEENDTGADEVSVDETGAVQDAASSESAQPDTEAAQKEHEAAARDLPPLSKVASLLSTQSSTRELTSRKLDTPNPEDNYFDPDAHIIGLALKGIEEGKETGAIAKMACLLDKFIYIDAKNKVVCSNLKDIHMRQIAIAPLGKGENGLDTELEMLESTTLEEVAGTQGSTYPMETFIWELAVLTSKGRAPKGTPMNEPTYLKQWPNFTRLMPIPNAMKVSAYWLQMPATLPDLSSNLDVPLSDILSLYSAASLTGLAGLAQRSSDKMLKQGKPEKHEKRNLFGSIMGSLKKN